MSGLHIVYGVMGGGKTNIVVNKYLLQTNYNKIFANVEFTQNFIDAHKEWTFETFGKYEPLKVIEKITSDNPRAFFIVDESQLCLTSLNVTACKDFAKRMTQIRQDDQEVYLIAQSSKLLPSMIKALATDCFKCENLNTKGKEKTSKITQYNGGETWKTKQIDSFFYQHVYGNYVTSNWEDTDPPKDLYKKQKIKLLLLVLLILFLIFGGFFFSKKFLFKKQNSISPEKEKFISELNSTVKDYEQSFFDDFECYRSFVCDEKGICFYMNGYGQFNSIPISEMSKHRPCPIDKKNSQNSEKSKKSTLF